MRRLILALFSGRKHFHDLTHYCRCVDISTGTPPPQYIHKAPCPSIVPSIPNIVKHCQHVWISVLWCGDLDQDAQIHLSTDIHKSHQYSITSAPVPDHILICWYDADIDLDIYASTNPDIYRWPHSLVYNVGVVHGSSRWHTTAAAQCTSQNSAQKLQKRWDYERVYQSWSRESSGPSWDNI